MNSSKSLILPQSSFSTLLDFPVKLDTEPYISSTTDNFVRYFATILWFAVFLSSFCIAIPFPISDRIISLLLQVWTMNQYMLNSQICIPAHFSLRNIAKQVHKS